MKFFYKSTFFAVILSSLIVAEVKSQSTNGEGDPSGRENWFPNRGNVGIGTRKPSEDLEVIGNVKVTSTLFSDSIETIGLKAVKGTFLDDVVIDHNLTIQGKVGIGIPNPAERFEVDGNAKFSQTVFAAGGVFSNNLLVDGNLGLGVASPAERLEVDGNVKVSQTVLSQAIEANTVKVNETLETNNLDVAGNVGIGITSPSEKLEVNGNIRTSGSLLVEGNTEMVGGLVVNGPFSAPGFSLDDMEIGSLTVTNALNLNQLMVATSSVPENFKMAVGGNIIATGIDIKIPEKWPDYVFTSGHKRLTLEELQVYIDEHGHLPGFAPAKQMEQLQHFNVAEMNMKLLEKIEELSLYVIELKEEIEALKKASGN